MTGLTDEQETLVRRLRALLELLPPALDRQVAALGLTSFEFALLQTVQREPGGRLRLSRLATSTNATLPRLSRVMNGLERKGLVKRVPDPGDARATNAVLTDDGATTVQAAAPMMERGILATVLEPLDPERLACFSAALDVILQVLDPQGRLAVTASTL